MILVSLIAGIHAVKKDRLPFLMISRNDILCAGALLIRPRAVGFHIVLRNQIQSVFIAETVQLRVIRIVAGADGIDVVALHNRKIAAHLLLAHPGAAIVAGKFMPVDAVEDNPLPVQAHQTILHFKTAESDLFMDEFHCLSGLCMQNQIQIIQLRILRRPERRLRHPFRDLIVLFVVRFSGKNDSSILFQAVLRVSIDVLFPLEVLRGLCQLQIQDKVCLCAGRIQKRPDFQILHMYLRNRVQIDIAENSAEAVEILILQPA